MRSSNGAFRPLRQPSRIPQSLQNILTLQIRIVSQKLLNTMPGADLPNNHSHRDPHPPNTRFAAHHRRVLCNPIQLDHRNILVIVLRIPTCDEIGSVTVAHNPNPVNLPSHGRFTGLESNHRFLRVKPPKTPESPQPAHSKRDNKFEDLA
jgi:hypothetical protein